MKMSMKESGVSGTQKPTVSTGRCRYGKMKTNRSTGKKAKMVGGKGSEKMM